MNPFDLLTKLIENPRTSGGAIVAAGGFWLYTSYGVGAELDPVAKYIGLGLFTVGLLLIGFGAADARNVVTKSEMAEKPAGKPATFGELAEGAPEGAKPLKVELVNPHDDKPKPKSP
jgi:hypothetical protein